MRNFLLIVVLIQLFVSFMTWFLKTSFVIGQGLGQIIAAAIKHLIRLLQWLWRTVPTWFRKQPPVK